mmetsp:Transcript_19315/g.41260  ORF Transcript_19315/g.41260 Transcript_19315/m.41260 type:complete len:200 (-) Transcript_19315:363-962(-)
MAVVLFQMFLYLDIADRCALLYPANKMLKCLVLGERRLLISACPLDEGLCGLSTKYSSAFALCCCDIGWSLSITRIVPDILMRCLLRLAGFVGRKNDSNTSRAKSTSPVSRTIVFKKASNAEDAVRPPPASGPPPAFSSTKSLSRDHTSSRRPARRNGGSMKSMVYRSGSAPGSEISSSTSRTAASSSRDASAARIRAL